MIHTSRLNFEEKLTQKKLELNQQWLGFGDPLWSQDEHSSVKNGLNDYSGDWASAAQKVVLMRGLYINLISKPGLNKLLEGGNVQFESYKEKAKHMFLRLS